MSATFNNQIEILISPNKFRNHPKSPDEVGTVTFPDGTQYEVAIWNRVSSRDGSTFKSGVLRLPNPQYANRNQQKQQSQQPESGAVNVDF